LLGVTDEYYAKILDEALDLSKSDNLEWAPLTVMVNALMNLDEFIVKNGVWIYTMKQEKNL